MTANTVALNYHDECRQLNCFLGPNTFTQVQEEGSGESGLLRNFFYFIIFSYTNICKLLGVLVICVTKMCERKLLATLLYIFVLFYGCDCEEPCNPLLSVDITSGSKLPNGTIEHNGLRYNSTQYFTLTDEVNENYTMGCICSVKTCMRKCCRPGYGLKENACVPSEENIVKTFNPQIHEMDKETSNLTDKNQLAIVYNHSCPYGTIKVTLNPDAEHLEDAFYLQAVRIKKLYIK